MTDVVSPLVVRKAVSETSPRYSTAHYRISSLNDRSHLVLISLCISTLWDRSSAMRSCRWSSPPYTLLQCGTSSAFFDLRKWWGRRFYVCYSSLYRAGQKSLLVDHIHSHSDGSQVWCINIASEIEKVATSKNSARSRQPFFLIPNLSSVRQLVQGHFTFQHFPATVQFSDVLEDTTSIRSDASRRRLPPHLGSSPPTGMQGKALRRSKYARKKIEMSDSPTNLRGHRNLRVGLRCHG
jgi:hypothetical protein